MRVSMKIIKKYEMLSIIITIILIMECVTCTKEVMLHFNPYKS